MAYECPILLIKYIQTSNIIFENKIKSTFYFHLKEILFYASNVEHRAKEKVVDAGCMGGKYNLE